MADIAVLPTSKVQGEQFEQTHVRKIYDEIANSVNDIEHKAWPKVKRFLKKFDTGSLIADIGCGNGRYLNINENVYKIGLDVCCALVDNSRLKGYEVCYADNLNIPLRDGLFDGVVSIGVIHHFCSIERRIKALQELSRILKPGGKVMLYVWAYEQKHRKFDSQDVLIPWYDGTFNRRQGSTSSRHSSLGGLSSTSSVSEEDSIDFTKDDIDTSPNKSLTIARKNSVSLDDLSTVTELNFKPSYYSLDFTGSPNKSDKLGSSVGSKDGRKTLVTECRKFEESMRALSANDLEELRARNITQNISERNLLITKNNTGHLSLEDINNDKQVGSNATFELNDENEISFMDEEMLEMEGLTFCQEVKYLHRDKPELRCHPGRRKTSRDRNSSQCVKVNPFMKQNSFDSYTFNNVAVSSDDSDSLEDIMEVESENAQDDVFVKFKPEKGAPNDVQNKPTEKEKSFFSSLKTKLLSIFDDDKKDDKKEQDGYNKHLNSSQSLDSAQLSQEQMNLADKLNFRVREFPQSSCPEVLNNQSFDNGYCIPTPDSHTLQTYKNGDFSYLNYRFTSESFHKMSGHADNSYLSTISDPDPSKLYKLGKEKMHEYLVKNQNLDSQISVEEVIYDGFIKLDVRVSESDETKSRSEETKSQSGALANDINAKDTSLLDHSANYCQKDSYQIKSDVKVTHNEKMDKKDEIQGKDLQSHKTSIFIEEYIDEKDDIFTEKKNVFCDKNSEILEDGMSTEFLKDNLMNDSGISEKEDSTKGKLCRYYHVFREGELESLITSHIPSLKVIQGFYDHANWCVVAEKY